MAAIAIRSIIGSARLVWASSMSAPSRSASYGQASTQMPHRMQRLSSTLYFLATRGLGMSAPLGHVSAQRPHDTHGVSFRLMSSGVVTSVAKPIRMKAHEVAPDTSAE